MEKRVIKFNLVGAICILILALAIIIGSLVAIPKLINKGDSGKTKDGTSIKKLDGNNAESSDAIDFDKDYSDKVNITKADGTTEEREIKTRYFKSDLGYVMKFAPDYFYIVSEDKKSDRIYSLLSNEIGIDIELKEGKLEDVRQKLDEEKQQRLTYDEELYRYNPETENNQNEENAVLRRVGEAYVNEINVNGSRAVKRLMVSNNDTDIVYVIQKDDNNYYYVHAFCTKQFEKDNLPVMELMLESFKVN